MMQVELFGLVGGKAVLAGAGPGAHVLGLLVALRPSAAEPTVMLLDFSGIGVATTSFLRECVLAFRDYCRANTSFVYPVCANLSPEVEEELINLLIQRGDAMAVCETDSDGHPVKPRVIGLLDAKQAQALRLVIEAGETDAPTLSKEQGDSEKVGTTAWNNRLAALSRKSLLLSTPTGRSIRFRPVLRGMSYGP